MTGRQAEDPLRVIALEDLPETIRVGQPGIRHRTGDVRGRGRRSGNGLQGSAGRNIIGPWRNVVNSLLCVSLFMAS
jgi:hypothetical protein